MRTGSGQQRMGRLAGAGALAAVVMMASCAAAWAMPARVILLRHGEKAGPYELCKVGERRAEALAKTYLGKDATSSLFRPGERPAAILTITPHTAQTASPIALSWPMTLTAYSVEQGFGLDDWYSAFGPRTIQAVQDMRTREDWKGKTVVVMWDNTRIVQEKHPRYKARDIDVTLYNLLDLHKLKNVPDEWADKNYNYFWLIDFNPETGEPVKFEMMKQEFTGEYADLPHNDWGQPSGLTKESGCALGRGSLKK